jgi:phage portal protein BeeE
VLHVKEFHPLNDWYGLSPVEPAAYGIDRHNAASAHNKALLDNGAPPVRRPDLRAGQDAGRHRCSRAPASVIETAEKALQESTSGPNGPASPSSSAATSSGRRWVSPPRTWTSRKGKEDAARDICISFGVPHILIVPGQSTYNNVREAKLELWEDTILPLLDKAVDNLNAWLVPQVRRGPVAGADLDERLRPGAAPRGKRTSVVELCWRRA